MTVIPIRKNDRNQPIAMSCLLVSADGQFSLGVEGSITPFFGRVERWKKWAELALMIVMGDE